MSSAISCLAIVPETQVWFTVFCWFAVAGNECSWC